MTNNNDIAMKNDELLSQKTAIVTTSGAVLGAVLVKLRTDKGMTQGDLAAAVGVGPPTWSRIERGESGLSIEQLKDVAKALNETPWHLLQIADNGEKELAKRGIYIDESSTSPRALADSLAAGSHPYTGEASGAIVGGALGALSGAATNASLASLGGGALLLGAVMPIAGLALAAMLGISNFLDMDKTD